MSRYIYRGALHKFISTVLVDFENESYTNIGGLVTDHLNSILNLIKYEPGGAFIFGQDLDFMVKTDIAIEVPVAEQFFNQNPSCCIISGNVMVQLRILGENNFTNIWLVDRAQALMW